MCRLNWPMKITCLRTYANIAVKMSKKCLKISCTFVYLKIKSIFSTNSWPKYVWHTIKMLKWDIKESCVSGRHFFFLFSRKSITIIIMQSTIKDAQRRHISVCLCHLANGERCKVLSLFHWVCQSQCSLYKTIIIVNYFCASLLYCMRVIWKSRVLNGFYT